LSPLTEGGVHTQHQPVNANPRDLRKEKLSAKRFASGDTMVTDDGQTVSNFPCGVVICR
jgi:hypothetical protein